MNNLHRGLAPISEMAWTQIDEEARRTLRRYLGARRVVGVQGPKGVDFPAVGTGHLRDIPSLADGVLCAQREVKPLVELRVPFDLTRKAIDDVERGSNDSDWQALKEAARRIALAEDHLILKGYPAAGIEGMLGMTSNPIVALPGHVDAFPEAVAAAVNQLRLAGVNGPYALMLGTSSFTEAAGGTEEGYPVLKHLETLIDGEVIWSQADMGGAVVTTRGGDFELHLGQDISIGYLSHSPSTVTLYLQETLTFLMQTAEAVVVLER